MGCHRVLGRAIGALKPIARNVRPYAGNGGAVYAWWPTVDANNMVDANYMSMDMTGCTFDGTRTRDNGGAVSVLGGDVVRITSCSFNQTEASGANKCGALLS